MNDLPADLVLPAFYSYYESPVKVIESEGDRAVAFRLSKDTGGWVAANHLVDKLLLGGDDEIEELTVDEFIQLTEHDRGYYLRGEAPVFALYETVRAIRETQAHERRRPTPTEVALIAGIQRRTFAMFEEMLKLDGDPAADPALADAAHRDIPR
ncbi:hypothetical protein [Micromonospora sp. NPDC049497]|uniref:hypothetical protein n=1 Tax=Micromonospora sp. NPDC049497 TaxID=3364273 RepID=UPI0037A6D864